MSEGFPKVAAKNPAVLDLEPGTYYWCTCGLSAKQPFCDGAHKACELRPMKVEIQEAGKKGANQIHLEIAAHENADIKVREKASFLLP